ncbi:MAG: DUF3575 domain-containing protein, partial [Muribaculaceae bacterium]|nr:DUF3575 domain-containing protein [Muribaculaceae bacterium]
IREAKSPDTIESRAGSGYASPEGASDANLKLSRLRCEEIADYISRHTGVERSLIKTYADGVAWTELRNIVSSYPNVPDREKVLYILDNTPLWIYNSQGKIVDGRKKQLMELSGGRTWKWLHTNIFPELRNAVAVMLYLKRSSDSVDIVENTADNSAKHPEGSDLNDANALKDLKDLKDPKDPTDLKDLNDPNDIKDSNDLNDVKDPNDANDLKDVKDPKDLDTQFSPKPFYMAVKTNMLYDAALVPNLGAEFYLGKNLSLYGEWMYAWWENEKRYRSWRIYGGDLGLRWWFGRKAEAKPLTGHHLGVYAGILTFDFATGEQGFLGGKPKGTLWDRHLINAGVEYGYSLPVAKRLNIDFSIGLGYLGGHYIKYFPFDNELYRDKEINLRFFGPTKAEISLVWLIGRGNTNERKGGER